MSNVINALLQRVHTSKEVVLAIDPGVTTGWALLNKGDLKSWDQINPLGRNKPALEPVVQLIHNYAPLMPVVVIEKFLLYAHRRKQQTGSTFPAVEVIGATRLTTQQLQLVLVEQSASQAKGLVTDQKLRAMEMWLPGLPHVRDAVRHALYYVLTKKLV